MKSLSQLLVITSCFATNVAMAVGEQGTGDDLVISIDENERIILHTQQDNSQLIGSQVNQNGYVEMSLDAVKNGVLTPNWGSAAIILDCNSADVRVMQRQQNGTDEEILIERVNTEYCPQQP